MAAGEVLSATTHSSRPVSDVFIISPEFDEDVEPGDYRDACCTCAQGYMACAVSHLDAVSFLQAMQERHVELSILPNERLRVSRVVRTPYGRASVENGLLSRQHEMTFEDADFLRRHVRSLHRLMLEQKQRQVSAGESSSVAWFRVSVFQQKLHLVQYCA
jgi:hypothetical protein